MTPLQAFILGLIQGMTEFLPVSSSGHLVIAQKLFHLSQAPVFFDTLIHIATLTAVIVFLRKDLFELTWDTISAIIIASIPTGIAGLLLAAFTDFLFNSLAVVAAGLVVTSIALFSTQYINQPKSSAKLSAFSAFIIGLAQAATIIPGISRSGTTIITALWLGISYRQAFTFSFLISIPAIIAAQSLKLKEAFYFSDISLTAAILGFISAATTGLLALKILKKALSQKKLHAFSGYTLSLAFATLLLVYLLPQ